MLEWGYQRRRTSQQRSLPCSVGLKIRYENRGAAISTLWPIPGERETFAGRFSDEQSRRRSQSISTKRSRIVSKLTSLLDWLSQAMRLGACVVRAVRVEGMCVAHAVCTCEWGHSMRYGHSVCASVWACAGQRYSDRGPTQTTLNPPTTAH